MRRRWGRRRRPPAAARRSVPPAAALHGPLPRVNPLSSLPNITQDFVIAAISGSAAQAVAPIEPAAPSQAAADAPVPPAAATPAAPAPTIPAPAAEEQSPPAVVEALFSDAASPAGTAAAAEAPGAPPAQPARAASLNRSPAVSHAVRSLGPVAESSPAVPLPPLPTLAPVPQVGAGWLGGAARRHWQQGMRGGACPTSGCSLVLSSAHASDDGMPASPPCLSIHAGGRLRDQPSTRPLHLAHAPAQPQAVPRVGAILELAVAGNASQVGNWVVSSPLHCSVASSCMLHGSCHAICLFSPKWVPVWCAITFQSSPLPNQQMRPGMPAPCSMSRLRASIRRRLRRADSPPVPRSRDLSGRISPTSGTAHLPAIPEGAPASAAAAAAGSGGLGGQVELATLAPPHPAATAAVERAASVAAAPSPAAAAAPGAETAAAAGSQASRASLVEVDLSEQRPAPSSSPSRRRGLACACFAGDRRMQ